MLRRLIIFSMIMLIAMPAVFARKKSKKSGTIDNLVYTDGKHDFTFTILENWKTELKKPKDVCRVRMIQKDHKIPEELMQYPQMTKTPDLDVFVFEEPDNMTPQLFIDSLLSPTYKSDSKKKILEKIVVLSENTSFEKFVAVQKNIITIDGKQAIQWIGSAKFIKDLGMGEYDPKSNGVAYIVIKNGNQFMVFSMISEDKFLGGIFNEVMKMAQSLKWAPAE